MSHYEDILHLSRPKSQRHAPMSRIDRAAQFAPFAALTGHEAAIEETARLTDRLFSREDSGKEALNEKLSLLSLHIKDQPTVRLTYFLPDERKAGGAYLTVTTPIKKVDAHAGVLLLPDYTAIPFAHILDIESDLFPKE